MTSDQLKLAEDLISFIDRSPTSFNAVANIASQLMKNGFKELSEGDKWQIKPGEKYFVKRNESALISFIAGNKNPWESGFKIVGSHTDSPLLKVKSDSLKVKSGYLHLGVEAYGGGINNTWLDRDLSIAGRVVLKHENSIKSVFVDFSRAVGIIPNLAIHLNREVNKGFEYNKQNHLNLIMDCGEYIEALEESNPDLKEIIAGEFGLNKDNILEMDLFLYDCQKGSLNGLKKDMVSTGRIDNLAMCHSSLRALDNFKGNDSTVVTAFFDNEEIGSQTLQGADSNFLSSILDRIVLSFGGNMESMLQARHHSFLISADGAHALHPNFSDKHDPAYAPLLNKGPVVKLSATFRYATTSESASYFIHLCEKCGVPYQKLANRSDIPSGSTIGAMTSASLGIKTVDVGNPTLGMHSIRETQGVLDHYYMTKVLTEFYNS